MIRIFLYIIFFFSLISGFGQLVDNPVRYEPAPIVCYGTDRVEKVFTPPPFEVMRALKSGEKKSEFIVDFSLFPEEAKEAFLYAVHIWEHLIESSVPIRVLANWRRHEEGVLGSCYPYHFDQNFEEAQYKNVYYPIALAEKLRKREVTGSSQPDISITFNREINWYFGTDGDTPSQMFDFVTVALHELCHGLGFFGFFHIDNNLGRYGQWTLGDITAFDRMVEDRYGNRLTDQIKFSNPSQSLRDAFISGWLFIDSPAAAFDYEGKRVTLYSPSKWMSGSSIYHLDEYKYPAGNINSLMTPFINRGEAIHNPGPVTLGILADMGWIPMEIEFDPLKDQEVPVPVDIVASVQGTFELDPEQLFFISSSDNFLSDRDTVQLELVSPTMCTSIWEPSPESDQIQYYLTVTDVKGRSFRYPSEAPEEYFTMNFGPDTTSPVIDHDPTGYFLDGGFAFYIDAKVEDNVGLAEVYVEYEVDGVEGNRFVLSPVGSNKFEGAFPLQSDQIEQGDIINYTIVAKDASAAGNISRLPEEGAFTVEVHKLDEPDYSYFNNFNEDNKDFILNEYTIKVINGFADGALHSPHPYPGSETDDRGFNFTAILKKPLILVDGSVLSFDEIVLVEPGTSGSLFGETDFWDYVIVEGSRDFGLNWLPFIDGYDSRENDDWHTKYYSSVIANYSRAKGSPDLFVRREIDMAESGNFSVGDTVLIRFRLFSDPYAYGWGWAIDNLSIGSPLSASNTVLPSDKFHIYPNPFNDKFTIISDRVPDTESVEFELYSMHGEKIWSKIVKNVGGGVLEEIKIDLTPGIYLLVINCNQGEIYTRKVIKR